MMKTPLKTPKTAGFTIVELMIATSVFAVVLLVLSVAILQMSKVYFKGITDTQTQQAAQSLMNDIAQAIQLSPGQVSAPTSSTEQAGTNPTSTGDAMVCADTQQFSYHLGQQVTGNQHAVVWYAGGGNCSANAPLDMSDPSQWPAGAQNGGAKELLGHNMRLANLTVTPLTLNSYQITVRVVYGDADLLCSSDSSIPATDPASCGNSSALAESEITGGLPGSQGVLTAAQIGQLRCKNVESGGQFCAETELSTIVTRRVNQ